jgi:hypothetical protein
MPQQLVLADMIGLDAVLVTYVIQALAVAAVVIVVYLVHQNAKEDVSKATVVLHKLCQF